MKVKKISAANVEACSLPKLFDEEKIDFQPIQCVNWAEYPYKPKVNFRIAHTQDSILLHFKVKEESVRARYGEDNGAVWTDSCVEFFSIPAGDGIYYNIECNCIGTILIGAGPARNGREHAPKDVTALVQRWSSLGNTPFERQKKYRDIFEQGPDKAFGEQLLAAVKRGWPVADSDFLDYCDIPAERRAPLRGKGRPKKTPSAHLSDTN